MESFRYVQQQSRQSSIICFQQLMNLQQTSFHIYPHPFPSPPSTFPTLSFFYARVSIPVLELGFCCNLNHPPWLVQNCLMVQMDFELQSDALVVGKLIQTIQHSTCSLLLGTGKKFPEKTELGHKTAERQLTSRCPTLNWGRKRRNRA